MPSIFRNLVFHTPVQLILPSSTHLLRNEILPCFIPTNQQRHTQPLVTAAAHRAAIFTASMLFFKTLFFQNRKLLTMYSTFDRHTASMLFFKNFYFQNRKLLSMYSTFDRHIPSSTFHCILVFLCLNIFRFPVPYLSIWKPHVVFHFNVLINMYHHHPKHLLAFVHN